ncbi:hypothetical protein CC86DRAFT_372782 [Ophiobolus disseminans]|uniref:Uncharacterized protein n=1 Tax=Ophiobolus disseminans TaxID=1469910 RepID=A0A6A6ZS02_9PLEO|nr:hypothetical protein CC86DRAFT_372782 [Ophiobolus disseminans]
MTDVSQTQDEGSEEFRILKALIANKDMTPEQAVTQIICLTQAPQTRGRQLANHCYFTARALMTTAAESAPEEQHKLITFLNQLRSNAVTDPETGEVLEHDGKVVWEGLPTFGYTLADDLHAIGGPNPSPEEAKQSLNTIAFVAQLDASAGDAEIINFSSMWALHFIMRALDDEPRHEHFDLAVRLACMWFIHDAEKLWSKVPETRFFTLSNWQGWRRALEEAEEGFEDKDMKSVIGRALAEMRRVEDDR